MDSKFYVSLEAARLLKEKGYNEECDCAIDEDSDIYSCEYRMNQDLPEWKWSCPTKAEAIDWLESKGIIIGVKPYTAISFSYFILIDRKSSYDVIETNECFSTKLEAEDSAIIKALELL